MVSNLQVDIQRCYSCAPLPELVVLTLAKCDDEIDRLRALLLKSKRAHRYCEDPWYSCPKAEDGCADEREGTECNCGADEWNAQIDAALL